MSRNTQCSDTSLPSSITGLAVDSTGKVSPDFDLIMNSKERLSPTLAISSTMSMSFSLSSFSGMN